LQDEASCLQRRLFRRSDDATQNAAETFLYFITPAPRFVKDFLREDGSFVLQNEGVCGHCAFLSWLQKRCRKTALFPHVNDPDLDVSLH
jgi:hypothetical protein